MTTVHDYAGYTDAPKSEDALARLARLAELQEARELAVELAELALKKAKEALEDISDKEIPTLMKELGLEEYKTSSGLSVELSEKLRCSITGERRPEAMKWLEGNKLGGIIKSAVTIAFGRDEEKALKKLLRDLGRRKEPLEVERESTVHNATLTKALEELLESGAEVPLELFGGFWQRRAKVKRAKSKK